MKTKPLMHLLALIGISLLARGQAMAEPRVSPGGSAQTSAEITVYKSPTCGCCKDWIDHLRAEGFTVKGIDRHDMPRVKAWFGVDRPLQSCHTAVIGGYVIEGHVPADDIKRLLKERPAVLGLTAPACRKNRRVCSPTICRRRTTTCCPSTSAAGWNCSAATD